MKIRVTREQLSDLFKTWVCLRDEVNPPNHDSWIRLSDGRYAIFDFNHDATLTIDPSQVVEAEWIYEERVPEPGEFCSTWRRRIK